MGITWDIFSASGTLPLLKVWLRICVIGFVIESLHSFRCFGCIWSSPYAFWYSPLGEYYCHRHSSDSCRRDFDLVPLICRQWNALSMWGSSVHVYRFSPIFATDRMWFGCMSMYSSWKRQLLLCESCFAEALEFPLESFCVPTLHNPTVNMCPFAESSFWYQALQLFHIHFPRQQILTNQTVDNLLYFDIVQVKEVFANGNTAQSSKFEVYYCAVNPS